MEKPAQPPSNLAIVGVYYLRSSMQLFAALQEIIEKDIKVKGEYQLTDALQLMIEQGEPMGCFKVDDWLDCGNPETLLSTNRLLLDRRQTVAMAEMRQLYRHSAGVCFAYGACAQFHHRAI